MNEFSRQWLLRRVCSTASMDELRRLKDDMSDQSNADATITNAIIEQRINLMRKEKVAASRGRK